MKKIAFAIMLVLVLASTAMAAKTEYGPYVGMLLSGQQLQETDVSATGLDVTFDPGFGVTAYAGYHWPIGLRLELEGSYFKSDIDKVKAGGASAHPDGSVDMKAIMVNALWEFENSSQWFAYLGLGGGYGWSKGEVYGDHASDSVPLMQPILGVGYHLTENISMNLDYKYTFGLDTLDYDGVKGDFDAHRLGLGLRYNF
ncbi:porin family protein [Pseudodesulfovibrio tunisiensis]|uniref:porin family protein n=1 Tax=Pseudodesulfovibrio tunisiensis TaxID=463192 RepID=UPI001FB3E98D|nr:porin family protein [Pseudodesulfovibrio tunisiensis]